MFCPWQLLPPKTKYCTAISVFIYMLPVSAHNFLSFGESYMLEGIWCTYEFDSCGRCSQMIKFIKETHVCFENHDLFFGNVSFGLKTTFLHCRQACQKFIAEYCSGGELTKVRMDMAHVVGQCQENKRQLRCIPVLDLTHICQRIVGHAVHLQSTCQHMGITIL